MKYSVKVSAFVLKAISFITIPFETLISRPAKPFGLPESINSFSQWIESSYLPERVLLQEG
jgi:hypothetical protein